MSLSVLIVTVAIGTSRTTGADRQRLVAVNAAEAAVDASYVSIQGTSTALPCSWPPFATQDVRTVPDRTEISSWIKYIGSNGSVGCPTRAGVLTLPAGEVPVQAVITGTGTAGNAQTRQRTMEALVDLTPVVGDGLDKAMFGHSGIEVLTSGVVAAPPGQTADIYSNGNFSCEQGPKFAGSVIAPYGKIEMKNTCGAAGDVWARDSVALSGNKSIGGRVIAATGSITVDHQTQINGTLTAGSAITWASCTTLPGKCQANQSSVPAPPGAPFPEIKGDAAGLAAWTAPSAGYTHVPIPSPLLGGPACGAATGKFLADEMKLLGTKTLFTTDCWVLFQQTKDTPISADVAVFARQGVSTNNQVELRSSNGPHHVHFIQPFDAVPAAARPCSSYPTGVPKMGTSQNYSASADLSVLWYSPCNITYGNSGTAFGQVITGSVLEVKNNFHLTYKKVFLPEGAVSNAASATTSYKVDVVYKRETG